MIAYAEYFQNRWLGWFGRLGRIIPIGTTRKSMVESIRAAREALQQGELVCIFPEGGITRSGKIQEFRPGFLSILKDTGAPGGAGPLGRVFGEASSATKAASSSGSGPGAGAIPSPSVSDGRSREPASVEEVRQAVEELKDGHEQQLPPNDLILPRKFLRMCRRRMRRAKVADSTGVELTGAGLLMRTLILRRLLRREVLAPDERNVGLLLPPSVAAVVANAALGSTAASPSI